MPQSSAASQISLVEALQAASVSQFNLPESATYFLRKSHACMTRGYNCGSLCSDATTRISVAEKKLIWGLPFFSFMRLLLSKVLSKIVPIRHVWLVWGKEPILVAVNHSVASCWNVFHSLLLMLCLPFRVGFMATTSL